MENKTESQDIGHVKNKEMFISYYIIIVVYRPTHRTDSVNGISMKYLEYFGYFEK